jgi:hypothetical protein
MLIKDRIYEKQGENLRYRHLYFFAEAAEAWQLNGFSVHAHHAHITIMMLMLTRFHLASLPPSPSTISIHDTSEAYQIQPC